MTYESGGKEDERMCDVFDPDGVFILRISLPAPKDFAPDATRSRARNGRFYCVREKENGYKALVVYKMIWK